MPTSVVLPALGESVTEGTISRWLKRVGDHVDVDEPLVEVSTDKVDTEIPSPSAGVLLEIRYEEDAAAQVGAVLAVIGEDAPAEPEPEPEPPTPQPVRLQSVWSVEPAATPPSAVTGPSAPAPGSPHEAGGLPKNQNIDVLLPQLGESVTEGTVSRWLKKTGDHVRAGEPLVEVSTDKVDTEIPAPVTGMLVKILVYEDGVIAVGSALGVIEPEAAQVLSEEPEEEAPVRAWATPETQDDTSATPARRAAPVEPEPAAPAPVEPEPATSAPVEPEPAVPESVPVAREQVPIALGPAPVAPELVMAAPEPEPVAPEPTPAVYEPTPAEPESEPVAPEPAPAGPEPAQSAPEPAQAEPGRPVYVTPVVRQIAANGGVDLGEIRGTGVGGRIRKQDVIEAIEARKASADALPPDDHTPSGTAPAGEAPADTLRGTTQKMSRLRATIATRMVESLQTSAQLTATVEVDMTRVAQVRAQAKDEFRAREGVGLSYLPFVAKAVVEALKAYPRLNASIDTQAGVIAYAGAEHLGVAVDTERGLLVPVIRDAGDLSVTGLAKKIADAADRCRSNSITPDELAGGTFTITNYGSAGTLMDTPIINQPQAGILGVGAIVRRPVAVYDPGLGEVVAIRDMVYLSLSYDHRLVDGADAGRFLSFVKQRLEAGDFAGEFVR